MNHTFIRMFFNSEEISRSLFYYSYKRNFVVLCKFVYLWYIPSLQCMVVFVSIYTAATGPV